MKEQDKTKKQLISELEEMHQQVTALEAIELDRSQAKEQLAKSEVKYRRLFETAQDGILILDADTGTIVDVNPFLVDMLGYSKEEFLGKKIWEVGAFKNIEASKTAFAKLRSEHYIRYEDMPLEAKNGKLINVEFVSNVYDVDQTRVIQCNIRDITVRKRVEEELLVCRNKLEEKVEKRTFELEKTTTKLQEDITERKKVEGNLAASEELLRAFTEVLPDLAFILDENGRYIDILVRKANLLYQEASKTIGQTLHDILPKEVADLNLEAIQKVIKTGEMQTIEYHLDVPAGTRYFEARLSPMRQYERGLNMVAAIIRDITEEKHAKDELLQEKNFITSVIDTAQTIILILDKQGRISRFNPYMEQISGYRLDEVLGKDWFNTFLPEPTRASTRKQFGQSINDIQTRGNVDKIVTKDGSELDIEWSAKTMKDASGNTVGLIAVGQDITERKQVEAALREAEFQYRTVADFTYDWEYWENPDGTYRYISPSCERISGYKADEFISNPDLLFEIIVPEYKEIWLQYVRQRVKKHRKNVWQFCIQRKDGEMCWIEHASQLVFDDQGKFLGYRASNRDITERRKAEEILRESEGRFRTLFESTVEGILIADVETKKQQYANPAICTLLGYSKEELTKMSVEDIHPKDSLEYVLAEFDAQARGEKKLSTLPCLKKNGTIFYADINTTKAIIDGRECNIGFFTDVTEHRLAQQ